MTNTIRRDHVIEEILNYATATAIATTGHISHEQLALLVLTGERELP